MSNYPPQQPFPPQQPQKKKTSPIVWILVGCGGLVVVGVIVVVAAGLFAWQRAKEAGFDPELMERNPAFAAAKIAVSTNPELELVSADEKKGTITIREKKTGKTVTVSFEDAAEGKISFKAETDEGEVGELTVEAKREGSGGTVELKSGEGTLRLGEGAAGPTPGWLPSYPGAATQGFFSARTNEGVSQSFHFTTSDSAEAVLRFYKEGFEAAGFNVNENTLSQSGQVTGGTVTAEDDGKRRTALIAVGVSQQGTQVTVSTQSKDGQ